MNVTVVPAVRSSPRQGPVAPGQFAALGAGGSLIFVLGSSVRTLLPELAIMH